MYRVLTKDELISILTSAYAFETLGNILYFNSQSVNYQDNEFVLYNVYTDVVRIFSLLNAESENTILFLYEKGNNTKVSLTVLSQTIASDLIFKQL